MLLCSSAAVESEMEWSLCLEFYLWFALQGDLRSYVTQHEWLYRNGELLQLQKMACEIAAGLTHLHKHNFLHRLFFHSHAHPKEINFTLTLYYHRSQRLYNRRILTTTWVTIKLHIRHKWPIQSRSFHGISSVCLKMSIFFSYTSLKASFHFNFSPAWYLVEVRLGLSRVSYHAQLWPLSLACSEYMQRGPITQLLGITGCRLSFGTETWWFRDLSVNRSPLYFRVYVRGHGCNSYSLWLRLLV